MAKWWEKGTAGTEAFGEEADFLKFLASIYGSWIMAVGYRGIFSFQKQNSPLYRWWKENDQPSDASKYREAQQLAEGEKELWELSPEEMQGKFLDLETEPYPAPEGQKWSVQRYDPTTNLPVQPHWELSPVEGEPVEEIDPFAMTDYQKWQTEHEEKKFALQQQQSQWEQTQKMNEAAQQAARDQQTKQAYWRQQEVNRIASLGMGGWASGGKDYMELRQLASQWDGQQRALQEFYPDSPRNWILRSPEVMGAGPVNPFREQLEQGTTTTEDIATAEETVKNAKRAWNYRKELNKEIGSDPDRSLKAWEKEDERNLREHWIRSAERVEGMLTSRDIGAGRRQSAEGPLEAFPEQEEAGKWSVPRGDPALGYEVGQPTEYHPARPTTPMIPEWLQAASGLKGRVPEKGTKVGIMSPSAYSWNRLSPTQREQYAGLVDWSGKRSMEDIMWDVGSQIPRGSGRQTRWSPARQV